MKKYTDVVIGVFVVWSLAATYWYTIIHNKLNFANQSEIIDNHILEILIIIAVSFLLGYLLHKSINSIQETETKIATTKSQAPDLKTVKVDAVTKSIDRSSKKDDLKQIEGIGPAIEKLLNKEGINTYWQLAETNQPQLLAILTKAGPLYLNHGESTWSEQATLLRDGKMEEFKILASQLIGGNRVS